MKYGNKRNDTYKNIMYKYRRNCDRGTRILQNLKSNKHMAKSNNFILEKKRQYENTKQRRR